MNTNPKTIGFADNPRRSKPLFTKLKLIYGEELERLKSEKSESNLSFKKLTENEKLKIRERVRGQIMKEKRKEIIIWVIMILMALGIFVIFKN